jgi:hypothetical protein
MSARAEPLFLLFYDQHQQQRALVKKLILPFSPDSVVVFQVAMDSQLVLYA